MPTSGRQLVRWRDSRYARMCVLLICQVRSVSRDTLTNSLRVPATGGISERCMGQGRVTTGTCTNGPELKLDTHSTNNSDLSSFHEGEKRGIHSRIRCDAHLKTQPRKMQTNTQASVVLGLPHDPCPPSVSSIIFFHLFTYFFENGDPSPLQVEWCARAVLVLRVVARRLLGSGPHPVVRARKNK